MLADELERALMAQVSKLPDYVPTKYFSQRSVVKALWALKAAVVRDLLYRRPDRPLEATVEDLDALRWFFLLGGPQAEEAEALLKVAVDPRERAQLEIVRIEQKAFDAALAKVRAELGTGVDREAASLGGGRGVQGGGGARAQLPAGHRLHHGAAPARQARPRSPSPGQPGGPAGGRARAALGGGAAGGPRPRRGPRGPGRGGHVHRALGDGWSCAARCRRCASGCRPCARRCPASSCRHWS